MKLSNFVVIMMSELISIPVGSHMDKGYMCSYDTLSEIMVIRKGA